MDGSADNADNGAVDIVLATLNASWQHAAFGLRYLMANLGPLRARARMMEFTINQRVLDIVESVLARIRSSRGSASTSGMCGRRRRWWRR